MKVVLLSDIHGMWDRLVVPDGDMLVISGDLTGRGKVSEIEALNTWLGTLPHKHKIVIAGNHDECLQYMPTSTEKFTNAIYLQDQMIEIEGKKIYGTPWTPTFGRWAFMKDDYVLHNLFSSIPSGLDLLISHGPPRGILDFTVYSEEHAGSVALYERVLKVNPRFHVFGHIHEGYGRVVMGDTTFINASTCTLRYAPINPPVVIEI